MSNSLQIPISNKLPVFKFPEFDVVQSGDFVKAYLIRDKGTPLINFKLAFLSKVSPELKRGLNYSAGQMLTKGTKKRSAQEISAFTDYYGASLFASVSWDDTLMNITSLKKNFDRIFSLMLECINHSSFSDEEFRKFSNRHLSLLQQDFSDISSLAHIMILRYLNCSDYSDTISGEIRSLKSMKSVELRKFHESKLLNSNKYLLFTGNIREKEILSMMSDLAFFQDSNILIRSETNETVNPEARKSIYYSHKRDSEQVCLKIAWKVGGSGFKQSDDNPYFQFINSIFGGYFLSRLNTNLRTESGLTYGVQSSLDLRNDASYLIITTNVNKDFVNETIFKIFDEIKKMANDRIDESELSRAKQYFLGTFARATENSIQSSLLLQGILTSNLPLDWLDTFYAKIKDAEALTLMNIQNKYFSPESIVLTAVGNITKFNPDLFPDYEIFKCNKEGFVS